MSFKVLLILLSFATLATISHCHQVCLCCGEEIVAQDTTNCTSVGTLILDTEAKALFDFCKSQQNSIYNSHLYYLAYMNQFDVKTLGTFQFPRYSCSQIFNNFEGLIYRVPVNDFGKMTKIYDNSFYVGLQREYNSSGYVVKETLGGVSETSFEPFKRYYVEETTNIERYVYIVRFPVSYRIAALQELYDIPSWDYSYYLGGGNNPEWAGKFTLCNDKDVHIDLELSITEQVTTTLKFDNYSFFPQAYNNLGLYGPSISKIPTIIEVQDNEKVYLVGSTADDEIVEYEAENEYLIETNITVPPHQCLSGEIIVFKKNMNVRFTSTIQLNLGTIGQYKDIVGITRTGEKSALLIDKVYLDKVYKHHRGFITIPYNTIWSKLALGIIVGLVAFGLLLLVVIKTISFAENITFGSDWTTERYQAAALVTEEKAAIVRDRLARFGSYICNVGTWIYQEIK